MLTGFRNFILTFLISFLIFGVIAFFVVNMILESIGGTPIIGGDKNPVQVGGENYVENNGGEALDELDGKSFNMLFVGLDYAPDIFYDYYDPDTVSGLIKYDSAKLPGGLVTDGEYRRISADTILFVSVCKERKEFAFTAISPGTIIKRGDSTICLGDVFEIEGKDSFIECINELTGLPVDRYAFVSLNEFPKVIDSIDGVDFNVPCNMVYDDFKGGLHINIEEGLQHLDGEKALQVLRFNKYESSTNSRLKTTINFSKAVMQKMTNLKYITKAEAILTEVKKMIDTDFSVADLVSNRDLIFSYPDFTAVSIELPGTYSTIDGRLCFIPNSTACLNTLAPYRRASN